MSNSIEIFSSPLQPSFHWQRLVHGSWDSLHLHLPLQPFAAFVEQSLGFDNAALAGRMLLMEHPWQNKSPLSSFVAMQLDVWWYNSTLNLSTICKKSLAWLLSAGSLLNWQQQNSIQVQTSIQIFLFRVIGRIPDLILWRHRKKELPELCQYQVFHTFVDYKGFLILCTKINP